MIRYRPTAQNNLATSDVFRLPSDLLVEVLHYASPTFRSLFRLRLVSQVWDLEIRTNPGLLERYLDDDENDDDINATPYRRLLTREMILESDESLLLAETTLRRTKSLTTPSGWRAYAPSAFLPPPIDFDARFVCNVGYFPSRRISECVSRKRWFSMLNVIVYPGERVEKHGNYGRTAFIRAPSRAGARLGDDGGPPIRRPFFSDPPSQPRGFVGFAIDLLNLPPHQEHLRCEVLYKHVYTHLSVWETADDARRAMENGSFPVASELRRNASLPVPEFPFHWTSVDREEGRSFPAIFVPYVANVDRRRHDSASRTRNVARISRLLVEASYPGCGAADVR